MARSNTEVVSNLPVFKATRSKQWGDWALVTCPREDCISHADPEHPAPFLVKITLFWKKRVGRNGTTIFGRTCPYCSKVAKLPARPRG